MPTPVFETPPIVRLATQRVAQPVSYPTGSAWLNAINFLHGKNKHCVGSVSRLPKTAATVTIRLRYYRSPGAVLALVCVVPWDGTANDAALTIGIALGIATIVGTTRLDGSTVIGCTSENIRAPSEEWALLDVSGLTVGTAYDLIVTSTDSGATTHSQGVEHISLFEIPRDQLNPGASPSTEPGVNVIFTAPGNDIFAGTASTAADYGAGTERIIGQLNSYKLSVRNFLLNIATAEADANAWTTTSAAFATVVGIASARWYCVPRRYGTTAATVTCDVRIRAKCAAGNLTVRIITAGVGGAAAVNNDITCAANAAYTTFTGTCTIATDGTDGEAYIEINAKIAAGTGYIDAISVVEKPT